MFRWAGGFSASMLLTSLALAQTANEVACTIGGGTAQCRNASSFAGPTFTTPPLLPGYAIASLPSGTIGMQAYVTDQSVACPALAVAPTAGGAIKCRVWYNGTAWVGD